MKHEEMVTDLCDVVDDIYSLISHVAWDFDIPQDNRVKVISELESINTKLKRVKEGLRK